MRLSSENINLLVRKISHRHSLSTLTLAISISIVLLITSMKNCGDNISTLERIQNRGILKVVTRNTPTTYYIGPTGATGFEYDMATEFAKYIGVELQIIVEHDFSNILPTIKSRKADIAAAGITITPSRETQVTFSQSYHDIREITVYRAGNKKPENIKDLESRDLHIVKGTSHEESLIALKKKHEFLQWTSHDNIDINYLFESVSQGNYDVVIADSIDYKLNKRFYPRLRRGMSISDTKKLAWAVAKSSDNSLRDKVNEFLELSDKNGLLKRLNEKHYTYVPSFTYADAHTFRKHIKQHLHDLIPLFKKVANEFDIDWRFLAAISYQESHWNPKATSPTGVRGLMMLTQPTALQLNVDDRIDPYQSLKGGAEYFIKMSKKIPTRIKEPDRTWLALAAYNIGYGHLEDARVITQRNGYNPDLWRHVRESLPLLSVREHYIKTKHGYARGQEPVKYVRNIRNYYDLLLWEFPQEHDALLFDLFKFSL